MATASNTAGLATTHRLIQRVATRQQLDSLVGKFHVSLWFVAGGYAVLLLLSRLLAVIPDVFTPITLAIPPLVAFALGMILRHRPAASQSARLIDGAMATDELFLTNTLIDDAHGQYKSLVIDDAAKVAAEVDPKQVVPFRWGAVCRDTVASLLVLALAIQFLPQLDPFGKNAEREEASKREAQLEKTRKATAERLKVLKEPKAANSKEVAAALEGLKKDFQALKPEQRERNQKLLAERQRELSELWKRQHDQKMRDQLSEQFARQQFGRPNPQQKEWQQALRKGNVSAMSEAMKKMQEEAQKLAKMPESQEKKRRLKKLRKDIKDMSDFMAKNAQSKSAQASMRRALQQLDMASMEGLDQDALKALSESLQLSERELQRLGQNMRDLKALEDAMKAAQMAQQLNQQNGMKGAQSEGLESMMDYNTFYDQMLAQSKQCASCQGSGKCSGKGQGEGEGQGGTCQVCGGSGKGQGQGQGQGIGQGTGAPGGGGGTPGEANDQTNMVTQRSKSKLQQGRMLMRWKTKELSDAGAVNLQYEEQIREVKNGVSEAIVTEQIPPGYHDAIKTYFDSLETSR